MKLFNGLFGKKEKQEAQGVEVINNTPVVEDDRFKDRYFQEVNLTEKNVKIAVEGDKEVVKGTCYLQSANGNIQMYETDRLIFEVGKRSKAYKELEPFVGQNVWYVVLEKRDGDYGVYYRATIKHKLSKAEAEEILNKA